MANWLKSVFGSNSTTDCLEEIKQLSDDQNLTDNHLNFIRSKYPNELHSWKREKIFDGRKLIKIRMYNL